MSTALDTDIEALVGDMPADPCESGTHDPHDKYHDAGPATHYARIHCPACALNIIKTYCEQFTATIRQKPEFLLECGCGYRSQAHEMATILGPIGSL